MSVCVYVSMSVYMQYVFLYVCMNVGLSGCLYVCVSACMFVCISVIMSKSLYGYMYVCPCVVCVSV